MNVEPATNPQVVTARTRKVRARKLPKPDYIKPELLSPRLVRNDLLAATKLDPNDEASLCLVIFDECKRIAGKRWLPEHGHTVVLEAYQQTVVELLALVKSHTITPNERIDCAKDVARRVTQRFARSNHEQQMPVDVYGNDHSISLKTGCKHSEGNGHARTARADYKLARSEEDIMVERIDQSRLRDKLVHLLGLADAEFMMDYYQDSRQRSDDYQPRSSAERAKFRRLKQKVRKFVTTHPLEGL